MSYTQAQIKQLVGTLTDSQLKDLCQEKFPSVYADFDGKLRSDQNRDLVTYASKQGKEDLLLDEIKAINADVYNRIIDSFGFKEFQLYNLDLIPSIRECLEKINRRRGLIPMSFSCSNKDFASSFCEGLKQELIKETKVFYDGTTRTVIPNSNKITTIAREIGKKSKKLTSKNIAIFSINIDGCSQPEEIATFLNSIKKSFEVIPNFCSIIIMFKKGNFSYPSNVICNYPKVKKYGLCTWINILMNRENGWKEVGEEWQNMTIRTLSLEKDDPLDMFRLYEHLAYALEHLRENWPMNPQDFLREVEDNLNILKQEEEY